MRRNQQSETAPVDTGSGSGSGIDTGSYSGVADPYAAPVRVEAAGPYIRIGDRYVNPQQITVMLPQAGGGLDVHTAAGSVILSAGDVDDFLALLGAGR